MIDLDFIGTRFKYFNTCAYGTQQQILILDNPLL